MGYIILNPHTTEFSLRSC